jgi:tRNA(fMet)-specific endonuclease VapC
VILLDTDTCIELLRGGNPAVRERLESSDPGDVGISTVTLAELMYGAEHSLHPERHRDAVLRFASSLQVLPFTADDARYFGLIRATLRRIGLTIGPYDLQIAAQCLRLDATLVTHNTREFERVQGIRLEDWVRD